MEQQSHLSETPEANLLINEPQSEQPNNPLETAVEGMDSSKQKMEEQSLVNKTGVDPSQTKLEVPSCLNETPKTKFLNDLQSEQSTNSLETTVEGTDSLKKKVESLVNEIDEINLPFHHPEPVQLNNLPEATVKGVDPSLTKLEVLSCLNETPKTKFLNDLQSEQSTNSMETTVEGTDWSKKKVEQSLLDEIDEINTPYDEPQPVQLNDLSVLTVKGVDSSQKKQEEQSYEIEEVNGSQPKKLKKTKSTEKKFHCAQCNYSAIHKSALISHHMSHRSTTETTMYKCDYCEHETKRKADIRTHMIIHKDPAEVRLFYCANCPYRSRRKCDLKQHVTIHMSTVYKCPHCPYQTKNKMYLDRQHLLTHMDESEVQLHKCQLCSYVSKSKILLKNHTRVHEEPKAKFVCNWCGMEFKNKTGIRCHMLVHTCPSEMEMFRCDQCEFETKRKSGLKDHIRAKHTVQDKTYMCAHCPFKTSLRSSIRLHLMIHRDPAEVKKYSCDLCSYKAIRKDNVLKHRLSHRKEQGQGIKVEAPVSSTVTVNPGSPETGNQEVVGGL